MVDKVRSAVTGSRTGSLHRTRICLFGLTFKAGTDDLRDSPALAVAALLRQAGAELTGYDPAVAPGTDHDALHGITVVGDPEAAAKGAEAIVLLTEWPQFRSLDWRQLAGVVARPAVVDSRNLLDRDVLRRAGFTCHTLGRRLG